MTHTLFEMADFFAPPEPTYDGIAPLHFTAEYFHPDDLELANRWMINRRDRLGLKAVSTRTWRMAAAMGWAVPEGPMEHSLCVMNCSLSCFNPPTHDVDRSSEWWPGKRLYTCQCVQGTLYQAICTACRWNFIGDSEGAAVEGWHDHAFPGWRNLPIIPAGIRPFGGGMNPTNTARDKAAIQARDWFEKNYPDEWKRPFAPILTERSGIGTRHVPSYSPWGGFDMCGRLIEETS